MEKKSILIIDDNAEMRENIAEILELANYNPLMAKDGKEGVSIAKKSHPDLIICDIMMPELDGYGVLHILSKDPVTLGIPFVFLSARSENIDLRKGMGMGADDYLTKPFEEMELLNTIEIRLRKKEALQYKGPSSIAGIQGMVAQASKRGMDQLNENHRTKNYEMREFVYREGDTPYFLHFLNKGKIKAYKIHEDGKEYVTGLYNAGEFFGYSSLLRDSNYTDSARVIDKAEVFQIPKEDFFQVMNSDREVMGKFVKMLSNNILEKEEQLLDLAYSSVRKRVANALVQLYEKYNTEGREDFTISLVREDIASIVGTATETVIRALSEFKEDGFIESHGRDIKVLDIKGLKQFRF